MASILLVDDEAELRQIIAEELTSAGFVVIQASNGKQAIEVIRQVKLDLVITDLVMPGRNGVAVVREAELFSLPVVILTAGGINPPESSAVREVLSKPVDLDYFLIAVQRAIAAKAPARSHRRYPLITGIELRKGAAPLGPKAKVLNLSQGGMCVEWQNGLPCGASEVLDFSLEFENHPTPLEGQCIVRWVRDDLGKPKLGLEFLSLGQTEAQLLTETLSEFARTNP